MNGPMHFNPKWGALSALFFGLLFFLMGFGAILIERQSLLSDTVRYLAKAGSFTALKESIKERKNPEAIPAWSNKSGVELIFCYPVSQSKTCEAMKSLWSMEYNNFSEILFYPFPNEESWTATLKQYMDEDSRSIFLGYHPVFRQVNEVNFIRYQIYLRIPAAFISSIPEELIYTALREGPREPAFLIHREPAANGPVFELTWEETGACPNSKPNSSVIDLPEPLTKILARINLLICNRVSLH